LPPPQPDINGTLDGLASNSSNFGNATFINQTVTPLQPTENTTEGSDQESKGTTPIMSMWCCAVIGIGFLVL
jgi:hypothetical protein